MDPDVLKLVYLTLGIGMVMVLSYMVAMIFTVGPSKFFEKKKVALQPFLDPTQWKSLALVSRDNVTHNTIRFRFGLDHPDQPLGLPIGYHITLKSVLPDGTDVLRPYTPVTTDEEVGAVEFVIKVYPEGRMSQCLSRLQVGQSILAKGPKGRFSYSPNCKREIGMLAGGSGITPMWQVAKLILSDPKDKTRLSLIFANVTVDDILIKHKLDELCYDYPDSFKVYYVLNKPPPGWVGGQGFVSPDMIREHLPAPSEDVQILCCGPAPMNRAMRINLEGLGYTKDMLFEF